MDELSPGDPFYVVLWANTDAVEVLHPSWIGNEGVSFELPQQIASNDTPVNATLDSGTDSINPTARRGFHVMDTIINARWYAENRGMVPPPPKVHVTIDSDHTQYFEKTSQIDLEAGDEWNEAVLHEYGHYLNFLMRPEVGSAGTLEPALKCHRYDPVDVFGEEWASYFALAVLDRDWCCGCSVTDAENNLCPTKGQDVFQQPIRVLWDLHDPANEPWDEVNLEYHKVWQTMASFTDHNPTLEEFIEVFADPRTDPIMCKYIQPSCTGPTLSCSGTQLSSDSDGDGTFESGESGHFWVNLCNSGGWSATEVSGDFFDPPPIGTWSDNEGTYADIPPGGCRFSDYLYVLDVQMNECGSAEFPLQVTFNSSEATDTSCPLTITCVPYASLTRKFDAGIVNVGQPVYATLALSNKGSAPLHVASVYEKSHASDTTVDFFPSFLNPGETGDIFVTIQTTGLTPVMYQRTIVVESDSNGGPEEGVISFGVSSGDQPRQVTTNGATAGRGYLDVSGSVAVFVRGGNVWYVDTDSGDEFQLTTQGGEYPRVSGRRIVFVRATGVGAGDIFLFDLDTQEEIQITNLPSSQSEPDIFGDTIVWSDQRDGSGVGSWDIYKYVIGQSNTNGEFLVGYSSWDTVAPRIDGDYVAYRIDKLDGTGSTIHDLGWYYRPSGITNYANLSNSTAPSLELDQYGGDVTYYARFKDPDNKTRDQIFNYYLPTRALYRLTCSSSHNKKNAVVGIGKAIYTDTSSNDIFSVPLHIECGTETPLQASTSTEQNPSSDPRTGEYLFFSNQSTRFEVWGVFPPYNTDAGVVTFEFEDSEFVQNQEYWYNVDVRNRGQSTLANLHLYVTCDGNVIEDDLITSLAPGETHRIWTTWNTNGFFTGVHKLRAFLSPPPAGDQNAGDDSKLLLNEVTDDDVTAPTISNSSVAPGSAADCDATIETDEEIEIHWRAWDQAGVTETHLTLGTVDYPGVPLGNDFYKASLPTQTSGHYTAYIFATDSDDSPLTTNPPKNIDFDVFAPNVCEDEDGDGFASCDCGCEATTLPCGDCDDSNNGVHPGASEKCDLLDNDCDGTVDPEGAINCQMFFFDNDHDGHGVVTSSKCLCSAVTPFTGLTSDDCNDSDAGVWTIPGEVTRLRFSTLSRLDWDAPVSPGGMTVMYDTLRSSNPSDFAITASCVEANDSSDLFAIDAAKPTVGTVFAYLLRAENTCGKGTIGETTNGNPRQGRECP